MKRLCCLLLLFLLPIFASAEEFVLEVPDIKGFTSIEITVHSPATGQLTLSVVAGTNTFFTWTADVSHGENAIEWNGLGYHDEVIPEGTYRMIASLESDHHQEQTLTAETLFSVDKCKNALLFALSKSDIIYTDDGSRWICEMQLARSGGTIVTEYYRYDDPSQMLGTKQNQVKSGTLIDYVWDGKINDKKAAPGVYLLRFYEKSTPDYAHEVIITIEEGKPPKPAVEVIGPIMPTPDMTDDELWTLMQQPSAVANLEEQTDHLSVRTKKGDGKVLGTLHGQSQAVEVIKIEGKYAFIGAWNHEVGDYIEGWVPLSKLKVVEPNDHYGLLIDKVNQTMKLYEHGTLIATIPISTGLIAKDKLIRETAAGSFLTVDRVNPFKCENDYRYDYAIRYDGGNLIHQIGYKRTDGKRDYSVQQAQIGSKASQGCIRISNQPGDAGINAYWLYTHLPYGTRVLILDDPEQRELQKIAAGIKTDLPSAVPVEPPTLQPDETELVLTVDGDVVLGTREAWWAREDAFPAYLQKHGHAYPFRNLLPLFSQDDMTFVNLECVLKSNPDGENKSKEYRFRGLPEWTDVLTLSSIEQVSIANNHYIDYGMAGRDATRAALDAGGVAYSGFETLHIWEKDGWKIGFAGCRETVYKQDPNVVNRDIRQLKEAGCDVVIYTCHWGKEYSPKHYTLQTQIAAAAAAAGADIIIGGHPHVVQGIGTVGNVPVIYSLGNLMFGGTIDMSTFDGMLAQLRLRFDKNGYIGCAIELIPVLTSSTAHEGINDYCPVIAEGKDRERILEKVQADTPFPLMQQMFFYRNPSIAQPIDK